MKRDIMLTAEARESLLLQVGKQDQEKVCQLFTT